MMISERPLLVPGLVGWSQCRRSTAERRQDERSKKEARMGSAEELSAEDAGPEASLKQAWVHRRNERAAGPNS